MNIKNSLLTLSFIFLLASCKKDDLLTPDPNPVITLQDNDNMLMGNPDAATADSKNPDRYLMVKPTYTLSYSRSRGIPNWVSWHLQASDLGSIDRQDDFRPDTALPYSWYYVSESSYIGSGFDRGHNCPSGDRTTSITANSSTFMMTNMSPQAPFVNQNTWANMETYVRSLCFQGYELYEIMGNYGTGGIGSSGFKNTIDNGHVTVPAYLFKVVVVLPKGNDDINRTLENTRVICVKVPNNNTGIHADWKQYRTSVDDVEAATGYDLLSRLPVKIQAVLEAKIDAL